MQVQLLTTRTDLRRRYDIGDIIDVPEDEARRMFASNPPLAMPVRQAARQTAMAAPARETAVAHGDKSRRGGGKDRLPL